MGDFVIKALSFLQNFSITLCCAELFFCFHLPKRKYWWLSLIGAVLWAVLFSKPLSVIMPWKDTGSFSSWKYFIIGDYFNYGYLIVFLGSALLAWGCFKATFYKITMYCSLAYIVQNLANNINTIFRYNVFGNNLGVGYYCASTAIIIAVYIIAYFVVVRRYAVDEQVKLNKAFAIFFMILTLLIVSNLAFVTFNLNEANKTNLPLRLYAIMCNVLLVMVQYSVFGKLKADAENEKVEELLMKKSWQQEYFRDNAEIINRKCHDLKHEIAALRLMKEGKEKDETIAELEKTVMIYDNVTKTGNETLDIILTEYRLKCENNGIDFSFMADGKAFEGINSMDLYVLLGNALDNAVEAELCEAPEERNIYMNICVRDEMTCVTLENYFSGKLNYSHGNIVTSKEDKSGHGYGLKSIKMIADKYNGHLTTEVRDNRFCLNLLFPRVK